MRCNTKRTLHRCVSVLQRTIRMLASQQSQMFISVYLWTDIFDIGRQHQSVKTLKTRNKNGVQARQTSLLARALR